MGWNPPPLIIIILLSLLTQPTLIWCGGGGGGIIFDCTIAINALLENRSSSTLEEQSSSLKQALVESPTIFYWEEEGSVRDMFPDKFLKIMELLVGLHPGFGSGPSSTPIFLGFNIDRSKGDFVPASRIGTANSFGKLVHRTATQLQSSLNRTLLSKQIVLSWAPYGSCSYPHPTLLRNMAFTLYSIEYSEHQLECKKLDKAKDMGRLPLRVLFVEFIPGQRFPESYSLFVEYLEGLLSKNLKWLQEGFGISSPQILFRLKLVPGGPQDDLQGMMITDGYAGMLSRFAYQWAMEQGHKVIIEMSPLALSNYKKGVEVDEGIVPTIKNTVFPILHVRLYEQRDLLAPDLFIQAGAVFSHFVALVPEGPDLPRWLHKFDALSLKLTAARKNHNNTFQIPKVILSTRGYSPFTTYKFQNYKKDNNKSYDEDELHLKSILIDSKDLSPRFEPTAAAALSSSKDIGCAILNFPKSFTPSAYFNASTFVEGIARECGLQKQSGGPQAQLISSVLLKVDTSWLLPPRETTPSAFTNDGSYYLETLQPKLASLYSGVSQLRKDYYPSVKQIILQLPSNLGLDRRLGNLPPGGLYCNGRDLRRNQMLEAFVAWAYFHNVTIVLKGVLNNGQDFESGWWDRIGGSVGGKYDSVLVARNVPPSMTYLGPISPCLTRTDEIPTKRVPIFEDGIGAVFHVRVPMSGGKEEEGGGSRRRMLTRKEFETQLRFALGKFSSIQILGGGGGGGELDWLVTRLTETLPLLTPKNSSSSSPHIIFIELPLEQVVDVELSRIQKQLGAISKLNGNHGTTGAKKKLSLQISGWEQKSQTDMPGDLLQFFRKLLHLGKMAKVGIGLVMENCTRSRWLEEDILDEEGGGGGGGVLFLEWSHVVCVEPWNTTYDTKSKPRFRVPPVDYHSTMAEFLDEKFATRLILTRALSTSTTKMKKQFHFRFQLQASTPGEYLRMVGDLSQHAALYNMSYFPIKAFHLEVEPENQELSGSGRSDTIIADESPPVAEPGWWSLAGGNSTSSDLSDVFSYVELESEFLGQEPWRPVPIPEDPSGNNNTNTGGRINWWAIGLSGALATSLLTTFVIAAWNERRRRRYLTDLEELHFLNGTLNSVGSNDEENTGMNNYLRMRWDASFDIPKVRLFSSSDSEDGGAPTIIGAGNFGTVFKCLVKGGPVALKVPKQGSSREAFKASLHEIKILAHVGHHENIVSFVGAYVKEIRVGIVQVATGLCENGPLLGYLRSLARSVAGIKQEGSTAVVEVAVGSFDLGRFGLEVAAGMEYLAGKRVIHGDLAARNVFLDEHFTCKIGDFGLSRKLYEYYEKYVKQTPEPLPWRWMAPESLKRMEFSSKSDVWAYGVTLTEIYSLGDVPYGAGMSWSGDFVDGLVDGGVRMTKPKFCSDEMFGRILECWNTQPELRPTFTQLVDIYRSMRSQEYARNE